MRERVLAQLKKSFSSKQVGLVCLLLAIVNKSLLAWVFSSLKGDKALYLLLANNFWQTGNLAEPVRLIENGSTLSFFNPAVHSPLYSLLAAPFLWLTHSFFLTQFILSVIGWTLLYIGLYYLALAIFRQRWVVHVFILCSGFFLYPHEISSTPKDTLAVGLVLVSIVLMKRFIERSTVTVTVLLALTLSGLALIKLMYVPLVVALFFLFTVFVLLDRKRSLLIHFGLLLALLMLTGFAVHHFLFQPLYQLAASHAVALPTDQSKMSHGFYPENLLLMYPFVSSSFLNIELWGVQLEKLTALHFSEIVRWFFRLDLVLLSILLLITLNNSRQIINNRTWFFLIGASLAMIAVTLGLSVSEKAVMYKSSASVWTYVSDVRSFLLPIFAIQLGLFLFIFFYHRLSFLRATFFLLFLFAVLHGIYFTVKQSFQTKLVAEANVANDALKQITRLVQSEKGKQPALVTTDNFLRRYAQVKEIKTYAFTTMEANLQWMNKGDVYLIATHPADSAYLNKFPAEELTPLATVKPFVLHRYIAK